MYGYRGKIRKKYALGIKRKKEVEKHRVYKHRIQRCTQTLYALKKKTVCDNIEHGNHEYEGWKNIET